MKKPRKIKSGQIWCSTTSNSMFILVQHNKNSNNLGWIHLMDDNKVASKLAFEAAAYYIDLNNLTTDPAYLYLGTLEDLDLQSFYEERINS
jgi:hypothetical protein